MAEQQEAIAWMNADRENPDGYENIRRNYGVPVRIGQRIDMDGKSGVVTAPGAAGAYVWIQFDGQEGPLKAHPTWETVYYNEDGSIAADYRAKKPETAVAKEAV